MRAIINRYVAISGGEDASQARSDRFHVTWQLCIIMQISARALYLFAPLSCTREEIYLI